MLEFGEKLKYLRLEKKLNQKKLSEEIEVASSMISCWENGVNEPKISYLISLSKFFNVSTDYLLGISEEWQSVKTVEGEINPQILLKDTREFVKIYEQLSAERKNDLKAIANLYINLEVKK